MSADNGIYILKTRGPEYRVAHLQAIDNIYWHLKEDLLFGDVNKEMEKREDANMEVVYEFFHQSAVYKTEEAAMQRADVLYEQIMGEVCGIVEYGIQVVNIEDEGFPCCDKPHWFPFDNDQTCTNCGKSARDI